MNKEISILIVILLFLICFQFSTYSQDKETDLNDYYKFPFSLGMEYHMLSPFANYAGRFNVFEIALSSRLPIPGIPVIQPVLKLGMMQFDSLSPPPDESTTTSPDKWDHIHLYSSVGVIYSNRFAKNFELGAELLGGYSLSYYPNLLPEEGLYGAHNILGQVGLHINLNTSYNFVIDINPNLKYLYSLNISDFNSFIFGIGLSGHFRFGEDPDSPQAIIRSIKFSKVKVPPVFGAMQSFYANNPVFKITITNIEKHTIKDISVSFFQAGFMDSPTHSATIEALEGGETKDVELFAAFNQEVFKTEGITPLTGEIIATYLSRGKPSEQRQSVSYDLHDKTAIVWDDDRKAAAFITPADSALRNYSSFIRQVCKEDVISSYNEPLQFAMQTFHALGEIGCIYQVDPTQPFTKMKSNTMVVDSISLPRDTLKRIAGDCDDLTVLFCSMLETVGIETAFITIPGHIYAAFNTNIDGRSYRKLHHDRKMTINIEDELWIPVEITMIGKSDFLSAWQKGIEQYRKLEDSPDERNFYLTKIAQEIYRPVGLKEIDLGLQYGDKNAIIDGFKKDLSNLIDLIVKKYIDLANKKKNKTNYNRLGIVYAQFEQYEKSESALKKAINLDSSYLAPYINLGNLKFLKKDYTKALEYFHKSEKILTDEPEIKSETYMKVLLNISNTYYLLDEQNKAKDYYQMASVQGSNDLDKFAYLSGLDGGLGRAAESKKEEMILFIGEEE